MSGPNLSGLLSRMVRSCLQSFEKRWHYVVPSFINSILVLSWFDPGRYIGAGDVSPLIRNSLRAEAFSTWGHQLTGAGGTRSNTGRSVETFLIRGVELFGGDTLLTQRVFFAVVASIAAIGAVHVARLVITNKWAMAFTGVLAFVNPFVMLYIPNPIFPLALGTIGLLVGELVGRLLGHQSSVLRVALCSFPISYLSVNPPLVVVTVGSTFATLVVVGIYQRKRLGPFLRFLATAIMPVAIFHLWWVVPTAHLFASGGPSGVSFTADTSDTGWSWVNAQNDLHRIVTLTAHWGWDQYKPYSASLDSTPWIFMRWVLPVGALGGLMVLLWSKVSARRALGIVLSFSALALIVIAQGLHGTFEGFNLFLFENVPGWWLFRDPASKFGPLLTLLYVVLFGVMLEAFWNHRPTRFPTATSRLLRPMLLGVGVVFSVVSFIHPYPMLTGEVIPTQNRGVLPPSRVEVPPEWEEIDTILRQAENKGKVAVFPINDYYQVTTSWGYHGVDLANQFFDRPVIQAYPGGYFEANQAFSEQFQSLNAAIVEGDSAAALSLSRTLGASHIIIRKDTSYDFDELDQQAKQLDGFGRIYSSDIADVYELRTGQSFEHIDVVTEWDTTMEEDVTAAVAWTGNHVVDSETAGTSHANGFFWKPKSQGDEVTVQIEGGVTQARITRNHVSVEETPTSWKLFIRPNLSINGTQLEDELVTEITKIEGSRTFIELNGQVQPLVDNQELEINGGEVMLLNASEATPLPVTRELDDCNNVDRRPLSQVKLSSVVSEETVELTAAEHTACTIFSVPESDQKTIISFAVEEIRDGKGRVCLWNHDDSICEVDQKFSPSSISRPVTILADPSNSRRSIYLHASYEEGSGGRQTVASYSRPVASTVSEDQQVVTIDPTTGHEIDAPDGEVTLISTTVAPSLVGDFGFLQDCNKRTNKSLEEAGLEISYPANGVTLSAKDHSACVSAPITAAPGASLDLSFDFETVSGTAKPRFCVWQDGTNECVAKETLRPQDYADNQYSGEIQLGEHSGDALLFFYADSTSSPSEINYTNIMVTSDATPKVHFVPADQHENLLTFSSNKTSSDKYSAELKLADQKVLVTMPESHDPQWRLSTPDGWTSEQVVVDGYANGWFVTGDGAGILTMVYQPSVYVGWAQKASLILILILSLNLVTSRAGLVRRIRHLYERTT